MSRHKVWNQDWRELTLALLKISWMSLTCLSGSQLCMLLLSCILSFRSGEMFSTQLLTGNFLHRCSAHWTYCCSFKKLHLPFHECLIAVTDMGWLIHPSYWGRHKCCRSLHVHYFFYCSPAVKASKSCGFFFSALKGIFWIYGFLVRYWFEVLFQHILSVTYSISTGKA